MMVGDNIKAVISANPKLRSALYDMNFLPEQVETKEQIGALTYFAAGFALGKASVAKGGQGDV